MVYSDEDGRSFFSAAHSEQDPAFRTVLVNVLHTVLRQVGTIGLAGSLLYVGLSVLGLGYELHWTYQAFRTAGRESQVVVVGVLIVAALSVFALVLAQTECRLRDGRLFGLGAVVLTTAVAAFEGALRGTFNTEYIIAVYLLVVAIIPFRPPHVLGVGGAAGLVLYLLGPAGLAWEGPFLPSAAMAKHLAFIGGASVLVTGMSAILYRRHQTYSRAQANLQKNQDRLRRTQRVGHVGGWEYLPEAGVVQGTDELWRLLGLPDVAELNLKAWLAHYPPEARRTVRAAVQRALENGESFDLEVPFTTANGEQRWGRVRGQVHREDRHSADRLTGTLQNITERKEREQVLEAEQAALRQMYRITSDWDTSFEAKIRRLLRLGREYLDLPYGFLSRISEGTQRIAHASGSHPRLQPDEICPLSSSYCRKTIQTEGITVVRDAQREGWADDPAHKRFGLEAYVGSTVVVEGELYGTLCFAASTAREKPFTERERTFVELLTRWVSYELRQRRDKERLERKNERLDSFASVLSHDLRNPLHVATMRLDLIREGDDPALHFATIERALDRMDEIVEDVLTLTREGQHIDTDDLEICSLFQIAEASWDHVDTADATLRMEEDVGVWASEGPLRRLLENLFRNAVEHGGEAVTIRIGRLDDGFFVEDDGPGLPEEQREKVFKAGHSSAEGTGLGLSIVKSIGEAHGWTVSGTDGDQGGARFEIRGVEVVERVGV